MAGNQVRVGFGVTGVAKASSEVDKLKDKITGIQKQGARGFAIGAAAAATTAGIGLASQALSEFTDVIGDSITAAQEDEASQQKLKTALEANIPAWDGNTDAIEDVLAAREKLGFSDDEQRDSLATLVVATHDVTRALEVQRTAMDLARLKGISLADASAALIKVEGGQFRALKALGIQLKAGATAQDALTAVQKAAKGQAEDYAKTNAGKMLASQVAVNEAMETLGRKIMPFVADAATAVANAVTVLSDAFDALTGSGKSSEQALLDQQQALINMLRAIPGFAHLEDGALDAQQALHDAAQAALDARTATDKAGDAAGAAAGTIDGLGDSFGDMAADAKASTEKVIDYVGDMTEKLKTAAEDAIADYFDPIAAQEAILADRSKLAASEAILARKHTAAEYRDARTDINDALQDEGEKLVELGTKHKLSQKAIDKYKADTIAAYKALGIKVPADLQKIFSSLDTFQQYNGGAVKVYVSAPPGAPHKAAGGPVQAGHPYTVGERGEETFVPDTDGTIIPHGMAPATGSVTNNISITGADVSSPDRIAEVVRRATTISRGSPWAVGGAMRK